MYHKLSDTQKRMLSLGKYIVVIKPIQVNNYQKVIINTNINKKYNIEYILIKQLNENNINDKIKINN